MNQTHYRRLLIMSVLAFASMYVLMYAMVNTFANVYSNVNQLYMAGLMTAPMAVIELVVMRGMYHNKTWNAVIMAASVVAGIAFFVFIRDQTAVSDRQFLRSMIPHHASAILMCERDMSLGCPEQIVPSRNPPFGQRDARNTIVAGYLDEHGFAAARRDGFLDGVHLRLEFLGDLRDGARHAPARLE
jgi:hypothetical protein